MDDRWIENVDSFSAGNDLVLDDCDDNNLTDDFCNLCEWTTTDRVGVDALMLSGYGRGSAEYF